MAEVLKMADYISREAAIKLLTSVGLEVSDSKRRTVAKCINEIELMPAADVAPVVRCKDCKRWRKHSEVNRDYGGCCRYSSTMRYDDFCSQGERRGR